MLVGGRFNRAGPPAVPNAPWEDTDALWYRLRSNDAQVACDGCSERPDCKVVVGTVPREDGSLYRYVEYGCQGVTMFTVFVDIDGNEIGKETDAMWMGSYPFDQLCKRVEVGEAEVGQSPCSFEKALEIAVAAARKRWGSP